MRVVGRRNEREITFHASGEALKEVARLIETSIRLSGGGSTFIPKGVYRFRTHEEADRQRAQCLAAGMAALASERAGR
ncbi:MAG: hypothetical protein DCC72_08230 [Burkholderiales bacterium]|nr:MAG: hypothetical protein DCC72_08230 [Burkholderiales bacterium]